MTLPPYAKALAAAVISGLAPTAGSVAATGGVTDSSVFTSLVTAVVGGLLTYLVPNGKAASSGVGGLVVTVKTDVARFAEAFVQGLPALVESAARAAITPPSAPVEAPPVEVSAAPAPAPAPEA